jgi:hypothetical protein
VAIIAGGVDPGAFRRQNNSQKRWRVAASWFGRVPQFGVRPRRRTTAVAGVLAPLPRRGHRWQQRDVGAFGSQRNAHNSGG